MLPWDLHGPCGLPDQSFSLDERRQRRWLITSLSGTLPHMLDALQTEAHQELELLAEAKAVLCHKAVRGDI